FDIRLEFRINVNVFSSSRRRHTRSKRDWSSDVCSSDLGGRHTHAVLGHLHLPGVLALAVHLVAPHDGAFNGGRGELDALALGGRSEERRVGKEGRDGAL